MVTTEAGAAWADELWALATDLGVRPSDLLRDPRRLAFDLSIRRGAVEFRRYILERSVAPGDMGMNKVLALLKMIAGA